MALPENAQAIYSFLVGKGLTPNAAAGIAGNIQRESGGNPESVGTGGNGLIGWTPPLSGAVTGNPTADLQFQLNALMTYISQNGSIADINANSSTPTAAATYFSDKYERPGIPALSQRIQAAVDVANAAKSGNWKGSTSLTSGSGTPAGGSGGGSGGILDFPSQITTFFKSADTFVTTLMWITKPEHWVRILAFLAGIALLLFAIHALIAVGEGGKIMPDMPNIIPVPV
jgi:Phage tail lysozyme